MRRHFFAAAFCLISAPAFAQAASEAVAPATSAPVAAPAAAETAATPVTKQHKGLKERFEAANTTHDGHLTKEQATAAHMKGVVKHFDEIDADKKGYVTEEEIKSFHKASRAARKAAKQKTQG